MLKLRGEVRERSSCGRVARMLDAAQELERKHTTLPTSKFGKALKYLLNQQEPLSVFLTDARLPIHNNEKERDLRHIIVGRKNWMTSASVRGGQVACRLYSLVLSCRQNGVNPEAYIAAVLLAVATTSMAGLGVIPNPRFHGEIQH